MNVEMIKTDKEVEQRILEFIANSLEQSKDFVIDQAPDMVQQLLVWKTTLYTMNTIVSSILLAVGVWCIYKTIMFLRKVDHCDEGDIACHVVGLIVGVGLTIVMACVFVSSIQNLLYVVLAPKVFLLNYFMP